MWKSSDVARLLALVESERRYYQDLFALLPVAVAVVSADMTLASVNREFRHRFDLSHEDLARLRFPDLLPDPALELALASVLKGDQREATIEVQAGPKLFRIGLSQVRAWQDSPDSEALLTVDEISPHGASPPPPDPALGLLSWRLDCETGRFLLPGSGEFAGLPLEAWQTLDDWAQSRIAPQDRERYLDFYNTLCDQHGQGGIDYLLIDSRGRLRFCHDIAAAAGSVIHGATIDQTAGERLTRHRRLSARLETASQLSGHLAHVANNLLMIINGYAGELIDGFHRDDPRRSDLEEIVSAGSRLARLTSQLNPVPATEHSPCLLLANWLSGPGADFHVDAALMGQEWRIHCAEPELSTLAAAILSLGASGISLEVDDQRSEAAFRFHFDELTETALESLLDPFAGPKIDGDRPLGPSRTLAALLASGAQAWVEPELDGASLVVVFAVEAAEPAETQPPAPPGPLVILVDDEDSIRALLAKTLSREGYRVIEASSGEEALTALRQSAEPPAALITDTDMPGIGGPELASEALSHLPTLPVVLISGGSAHPGLPRLTSPGAGSTVSFIAKPFEPSALVELLARIIPHAKAKGASASS